MWGRPPGMETAYLPKSLPRSCWLSIAQVPRSKVLVSPNVCVAEMQVDGMSLDRRKPVASACLKNRKSAQDAFKTMRRPSGPAPSLANIETKNHSEIMSLGLMSQCHPHCDSNRSQC